MWSQLAIVVASWWTLVDVVSIHPMGDTADYYDEFLSVAGVSVCRDSLVNLAAAVLVIPGVSFGSLWMADKIVEIRRALSRASEFGDLGVAKVFVSRRHQRPH